MPKVALIIFDGFGISRNPEGNAVLQAKTPNLDRILSRYPKALLKASSQEVGLPWGEFGNSEVGHTSIGLGRVVLQNLPQIDRSFASGNFTKKNTYNEIQQDISKGTNLHIVGMCSDGAVHGHINHLKNLVDEFRESSGLKKIFLHLIADGRDCPEKSIEKYYSQIQPIINEKVFAGSLSGRYFAMDRDKNWDRIQLAYDAITGKSSNIDIDIPSCIKSAYARNETDEYLTPFQIKGLEVDLENDVFIFANYRADRAIQLTRAFVDEKFEDFTRTGTAKNFFTMTTYDDNLHAKVIFSNLDLNDPQTNSLEKPFGEILSRNNLKQFHVSETEKFAHVTYFFSGGIREPYQGQENKLIDSAKVKSHDLYPQMRANEISESICLACKSDFPFIVANFANGDMVGHSGNMVATVLAVETLDNALGKIIPQLLESGYEIILTSDHGNCDEMIDLKTKKVNKEHTLNPVPFIYISENATKTNISKNQFFESEPIGVLSDIAPSILQIMGLSPSENMTGIDIINSLG
jgi:2,3-bisphosphoglycerate-independent phosphoglycerate mutase